MTGSAPTFLLYHILPIFSIMPIKTNAEINGIRYYHIYRKVGVKRDGSGAWVDDYRNFYGKNKAEAEAKYKKYMAEKDTSDFLMQPFGAAVEEWIRNTFINTSLAPATKQLYRQAYFNYMSCDAITAVPVKDLTARELQIFYNELNAPISTINALHKLLRRFYKYLAVNYQLIDITASIETPKREPKTADLSAFNSVTTWNIDELETVLKNLNGDRFRLLIILAIGTGARISELLALQYSDIRNGQLFITKQSDEKVNQAPVIRTPKTKNSYRTIPLSVDVLQEIELHRSWHQLEQKNNGYKTDFIFTTNSGELYYKRNIYRALSRYYKRIGVTPHRFHDYRHTFATMLSGSGTPIEVTCALLGHADISTTAKYYVGINTEQKLQAVAKINSILTVLEHDDQENGAEISTDPGRKLATAVHDVVGSSPAQTTKPLEK